MISYSRMWVKLDAILCSFHNFQIAKNFLYVLFILFFCYCSFLMRHLWNDTEMENASLNSWKKLQFYEMIVTYSNCETSLSVWYNLQEIEKPSKQALK